MCSHLVNCIELNTTLIIPTSTVNFRLSSAFVFRLGTKSDQCPQHNFFIDVILSVGLTTWISVHWNQRWGKFINFISNSPDKIPGALVFIFICLFNQMHSSGKMVYRNVVPKNYSWTANRNAITIRGDSAMAPHIVKSHTQGKHNRNCTSDYTTTVSIMLNLQKANQKVLNKHFISKALG